MNVAKLKGNIGFGDKAIFPKVLIVGWSGRHLDMIRVAFFVDGSVKR